jgi:hypothetical protein
MGGFVKSQRGCCDLLIVENSVNMLGVGCKVRQMNSTVVEIKDK